MRGIEQVRLGRRLQGSGGAPGVALVAPNEVGQDLFLVDLLAAAAQFEHTTFGADLGARDDEQFDVGARRTSGIAATTDAASVTACCFSAVSSNFFGSSATATSMARAVSSSG